MFKVIYINQDTVHHFGWFDSREQARAKIKYLRADRKKEIRARNRANGFWASPPSERHEGIFKIVEE